MASKKPMQCEFDLIVLGSGAAGIHAAVQASKLHKRVCIIEHNPDHIGGTWIHTGTLPSKTLREGLASIHSVKEHLGENWVQRLVHDLHTGKLFQYAQSVSKQKEIHMQDYLKSHGVQVLRGFGTLENRNAIRVNSDLETRVLTSHFIFIATGSHPLRPNNIPFDGWRVIDCDDIFHLKTIPQSIAIYGAGVIGCEYASIFAAMGVKVTLIHSREKILSYCDYEMVKELCGFMEKLGVAFKLGRNIESIKVEGPQVKASLGNESIESDVFLWASGRVPRSDHLHLEKLGIDCDKYKAILVNEDFQTKVPNIYAAGDVIGPPALAATAAQQGRFIAHHAFGLNLGSFPKDYPIGIYTIPECSMVGKTEETLMHEGVDYVVGRAHYKDVTRSILAGQNHGLLKLIIDKKTHKILGIHIVGEDACNLVHIGLAFMTKNGHAQDFVNMVFNYPTLAEAYRIAALNGLNKIFKDGVIKAPPFERRRNAYSSIKPKK